MFVYFSLEELLTTQCDRFTKEEVNFKGYATCSHTPVGQVALCPLRWKVTKYVYSSPVLKGAGHFLEYLFLHCIHLMDVL